jgi:hypothetical protein
MATLGAAGPPRSWCVLLLLLWIRVKSCSYRDHQRFRPSRLVVTAGE